MKFAFYTLGCKVNQAETERWMRQIIQRGFEVVSSGEEADIYIVNSCTVTARSDSKTRQLVRGIRNRANMAKIVLTGCYASIALPIEIEQLNVNMIVPNNQKSNLVEIVLGWVGVLNLVPLNLRENSENSENKNFRTRAMIKIQDGCNRNCAYCIIPRARGVSVSKSYDEIKSELEDIVSHGFLEVVITGINLYLFGEQSFTLADVVELACEFEQIKRVRLGSLDPEAVTNQLIDRLKGQQKFCPHFHISLQSGCNKTLKAMNRGYNIKDFNLLLDNIRAKFGNSAAITTDVIVGFPGETELDFAESLEFVRAAQFAKVHVFPYSKRVGTKAAQMDEQISKVCKAKRVNWMLEVGAQARALFNENMVGELQEVLFESWAKNGYFYGHTLNYADVWVRSSSDLRSQIAKVRILKAEGCGCFGEVVDILECKGQ